MNLESSPFLSPWSRILAPVARVYGAIARRRRRQRSSRSVSLPVPVVSVGNITVGGTGKTPLVELIVRDLLRRGRRPAILSRGYGRAVRVDGRAGSEAGNDEYLVLGRNLPETHHLQNPDRVAAGRAAVAAGADVLVLDDGFQHVRLRRDLDIVLLDAVIPFGFGRVLPAGLLREPIDALASADLFVTTRVDSVSRRKLGVLRSYLGGRFRAIPRVEVAFRPRAWVRLDGRNREPLTTHAGVPALAFAGIGNPEGFRRQVGTVGPRIVKWMSFGDHHRYTRREITGIDRQATDAGARVVLLTQKDAVKIPWKNVDGEIPWRYLEIEPVVTRGEEILDSRLDDLLRHR